MKRIIKISVLAVAVSATLSLKAQVRLDSILAVVKVRNPLLKTYDAKADAMNAYAQGARNWMAPEVGGGLWMLPYRTVEDPRDKGQIMISVQQQFPNAGRLRANQNFLNSKAAIEQMSGAYAFNALRAAAKTAYYQWIILEKKKKLLQESEQLLGHALSLARLRYTNNQGKLSDLYAAEAKHEAVRNQALDFDNQIRQKNIFLNQLMSVPLATTFQIDTSFQPSPFDASALDALAGRRSDVRRLDLQAASMSLNQALERTQSKPEFKLSFNHMIARGAGMPGQFMLLGMVSIPVAPWSSRAYRANERGLDREIAGIQIEREAVLQQAEGAARELISEMTAQLWQIENYERRIVPALRKSFDATRLAYEENKEALSAVIDAWETLNATQMQYLDTIQKYYENLVAYEKECEN